MQAMTKVSSRAALLSLGLLAATCVLTPARAQLIDAGGQAALMQQHAMMRNQSTGDGPDWVDREALRRKNDGRVLPRSARQAGAVDEVALKQEMRRMIDRRRAELLPEYERRVRNEGRPSADRWLRQVATEMGRRDGAQIRARYGQ